MAEDILIQQLREIKYPGTIDITNKVMAEVSKRPLLVPAKDSTLSGLLLLLLLAYCWL